MSQSIGSGDKFCPRTVGRLRPGGVLPAAAAADAAPGQPACRADQRGDTEGARAGQSAPQFSATCPFITGTFIPWHMKTEPVCLHVNCYLLISYMSTVREIN